jgi:DNA-binding winged helix-turn-helix (wHTH) protein
LVYRFGPYEVDPTQNQLRKFGLRVRLEPKPFHLLVVLLQRSGELVTRAELQRSLWEDDVFVDFEHGLNKAINKVREALGDDADNPRFVETLPRRGYRFLAPVTKAALPSAATGDQTAATGYIPRRPSLARTRTKRWRIALAVLAAGFLLLF